MRDRPLQHMAFALGAGNWHSRDIPGLAHFTEHIVSHSAGSVQLKKDIEEEGGYLMGGGGLTSSYSTAYGFGFPANHPRLFHWLQLHRPYVFENTLSHSIEAERGPFAAEFQRDFGRRRTLANRFLVHRVTRPGDWDTPTIMYGDEDGISPFTQDQVTSFYRQHYTPANLRIIAVGPLSRDELCSKLSSTGWAGMPLVGTPSEIPAVKERNFAPVLNACAFPNDEEKDSALFHQVVLPRNIPEAVYNITCDALGEFLQDYLREKEHLIYSCSVRYKYWHQLHAIEARCSGIDAANTNKFWNTYQTIWGKILNGEVLTPSLVERMKKKSIIRTQLE